MIKGGNLVLFDHPPRGNKQVQFRMIHRDINGVQCNILGNTHMFKHLDTFKDFFSWKTNQGVYLSNIYNSYSLPGNINPIVLQIDEWIRYVKEKLTILKLDHRVLGNPHNIIEVIERGQIFNPPHYIYSNNGVSIRFSSYNSKTVRFNLISIYAVTSNKNPLYNALNWKLRRGDTDITPGNSRYIDNPVKAEHVDTAWGIMTPTPDHQFETRTSASPEKKSSTKKGKRGKRSKGGSTKKINRKFLFSKINHISVGIK